MIKRLKEWITGIIREELAKLRNDVAAVKPHVSEELATVRNDIRDAVASLKAHVTSEVERPVDALKAHIAAEITKQFDKILANAKLAAETALADARKTMRMPCEFCQLMSWKFTVTPEGKVLCGDCQAKGLK